MEWFVFARYAIEAIVAITAIFKWNQATRARQIGDVLITGIEAAGDVATKRAVEVEAIERNVKPAIDARLAEKGFLKKLGR